MTDISPMPKATGTSLRVGDARPAEFTAQRVVHITPAGGFGRVQLGGAERAVLELARETASAGHEVTIMAPAEFLDAVDIPDGVRALPTDVGLKNLPAICRQVRELEPTVVVAHLLRGVLVGGIARRISASRAVFVTNLHNSLNQAFEDDDAPALRRSFLRFCLNLLHVGKHSATVAISKSNFDDLLEHDHFSAQKVELISNWVAPNFKPLSAEAILEIRGALGITDADRMVLFVGRLERQKDPLLAVETIAASQHNPVLVVAGQGDLKDALLSAAASRGIRIKMIGHVTDIENYMAAADVLIVPSRYEGFGRVAVESLAAGTPVIGSGVAGLVDALAPFPPTWYSLVESRLAEEWAQRIDELLVLRPTSAERLERHERTMATYGLASAVSKYLRLYHRLGGK